MIRRTVRGRGGKRLMFHVKRRGGRVVRPKFDVIPIFNTMANGCQPFIGSMCGNASLDCDDSSEGGTRCCNTVVEVKLLTNDLLENQYNDKLKIVRLVGWVKIQMVPWFATDGSFQGWPWNCDDLKNLPPGSQYAQNYAQAVTMGIHKFRLAQTGAKAPESPTEEGSDLSSPFLSYPWTEARWLWQAHRFWAPTTRLGLQTVSIGSQMGCCPDVSGGLAVNTLSNGSGVINTAISTDCNNCFATATELACSAQWPYAEASLPPWQLFPVRIRKPFVLASDESLHLQIGLAHPRTLTAQILNQGGWGCSEFRNALPNGQENTYFQYHMKLRAVVQHNY